MIYNSHNHSYEASIKHPTYPAPQRNRATMIAIVVQLMGTPKFQSLQQIPTAALKMTAGREGSKVLSSPEALAVTGNRKER